MKNTSRVLFVSPLLVASLGVMLNYRASAQSTTPEVITEAKHDVSPPLRDLVQTAIAPAAEQELPPELSNQSASPTTVLSFDGITDLHPIGQGNKFSNSRADLSIAIGDTQAVESVEGAYEVFDKSANVILGPTDPSTIFSGFTAVCDTASALEFPVLLHDQIADRWFFAIESLGSGTVTSAECFAVSTSSDFTGSWNRYEYDYRTGVTGTQVDEGKFAVWPDAYYASYLTAGQGPMLCAYNRAAMLAGTSASSQCFYLNASVDYYTLPATLQGTSLPPAGEPAFFLELAAPGTTGGSSTSTGTTINLFRFHVDFVNSANSTLTGPVVITVSKYTEACKYPFTCIPQSGTSQTLIAVGNWLTYPIPYRNFGTYESILASHSVPTTSATTPTSLMWHEIRNPNGTPTVYQQGTVPMSSGESGWMGSIGQDKLGDILLGLTCSSSSTHPSPEYTYHQASDAAGQMAAPTQVKQGTGSQIVLGYWTYYDGMAVDPTDDCTFWYGAQFLAATGVYNWNTHLASLKFASCN